MFAFTLVLATNVNSQNIEQSINQELDQLLENNKITQQDFQWVITSQHTSRTSGITHVYYSQTLNGIEINGSQSSIHIYPNGRVLKSNNQFVKNVAQKSAGRTNVSINAIQAVQAAANHLGYSISENLSVIERKSTVNQESVLSKGGISLSDIPAKLVYQITEDNKLALSWDISIEEIAQQNWWSVRVDATSSSILDQVNWMSSCNFDHDHSIHETLDYNKNLFDIPNYCEIIEEISNESSIVIPNSYEVFAPPIESPYYGARTIETLPANPTASPFGWHDTDGIAGAEFTVTKGNNADAYEDGDNPGFQPDGGATLDFTGYPFDQNYTNATQYESAAITNLFYWSNIIHDVMYIYGFDEASGNFQENNYGNGGLGSDSVNSEAQDGSGTCNANFGTPPDGANPRMQMYVCGNKDGDFDNLVIFHEYAHGISNRLTGGPNNTGCLSNQEQMGEGWSDWYGAVMTIEPGDTGVDPRGVGTYLFGQGPGGAGIRPFPYSTDVAINPQTYDDIKTAAVPHGVGSVWATTIWEMTWALIDEHGWDADIFNFTGDPNLDAGNVMAMALVTEGLKLQPCSPGFVDGRDAIFAADLALYGGINECLLWDAFAKRGLGVSADQGSSGSRSDGTEAFDTPSGIATMVAPEDVCEGSPEITGLSGGTPLGGVYSGPGVTDDGNGQTFSFDPVVAGVGVHTILYEVPATNCAGASSDSDDIEVIALLPGPPTSGGSDYCQGEDVTVSATPIDPLNVIRWYDAATGGTLLFQGNDYTFTPAGNTSVFAQETPDVPLSKLVISEVTLQTPDQLEIQNVGLAADYTGYTVAVSDDYGNINIVNPIVQSLGNMGPDSVMNWNDSGGSGYWGNNLFWNDNSPGWIIIIDDQGNVVDSLFWNHTAGAISGFNATINGFNITGADLDWTGDGASFTQGCTGSYRRDGDDDDASNWANICLSSDYGVANDDINLGVDGCLSARTEEEVTLDAIGPDITCPADETVQVNTGEQYTLPDYSTTTTATDNCTTDPIITQSPIAGTDVAVGVHTITMTAEDEYGNTSSCTFDVTVEEILGNESNSFDKAIALIPNPSFGELLLVNNSNEVLMKAIISDVNGRIINTINLEGMNESISLSIESYAAGLYFISIEGETSSVVKRIIKK